MKTGFRRSFERDVKKLNDSITRRKVRAAIDKVSRAERLDELPMLRKLAGHRHYYRIRIGDYRLGLFCEGEEAVFVRCLHRRDIYRYFP